MRILVIDDDILLGRVIGRALPDHDVVVESDATSAFARIVGDELAEPFDLVVCDYNLGRMNNLAAVLPALRSHAKPPMVIVMSGYGDLAEAATVGADALLLKPVAAQELSDAIARLVNKP